MLINVEHFFLLLHDNIKWCVYFKQKIVGMANYEWKHACLDKFHLGNTKQ